MSTASANHLNQMHINCLNQDKKDKKDKKDGQDGSLKYQSPIQKITPLLNDIVSFVAQTYEV